MPRLRSQAGQVAAEYLGALLLVAVIIAALSAPSCTRTSRSRSSARSARSPAPPSAASRASRRPQGAGEDEPGEPDRSVYDDECKNDLPGDLLRGEGDDPSGGDPEANQVYDNLGQVFDYYADTFGRDSYDDAGAELIASINFCENAGHADPQRLLGRHPDEVRRRLRVEPRRHRPRAHARGHRPHRRPRVPVPVGRAQRVDVGHLRLQRRQRRLGDRRGPAGRRAARHGQPGQRRPAAARARRRLRRDAQRRQPVQRQRRRALQQRHPQPRLLPDGAVDRPQARRSRSSTAR